MFSFVNKLQRRLAQEESGFTLIELLIVLVIIGILLAILETEVRRHRDRKQDADDHEHDQELDEREARLLLGKPLLQLVDEREH